MDGMTLLQEARVAGLTVALEGDQLKIRGPKCADGIARKLIANKQEVVSALAATNTRRIPSPPSPASHACSEPAFPTSVREWDQEARELIAFFRMARARLPKMPFRLTRWQYISNPQKWYKVLELDIAAGPLGCRARMGVFQEDLRRLKEFLLRGDS
jgi:hypothetical protein